jgi:hypothetical protein
LVNLFGINVSKVFWHNDQIGKCPKTDMFIF